MTNLKAMIINKQDERYNRIFEVVEKNERFVTIQDGDIKADYGYSEIAYICITCGTPDKEGLCNGMCIDCFDMSLDIGKSGKLINERKAKASKDLEKRRQKSGYYN